MRKEQLDTIKIDIIEKQMTPLKRAEKNCPKTWQLFVVTCEIHVKVTGVVEVSYV